MAAGLETQAGRHPVAASLLGLTRAVGPLIPRGAGAPNGGRVATGLENSGS